MDALPSLDDGAIRLDTVEKALAQRAVTNDSSGPISGELLPRCLQDSLGTRNH